MNIPPVSGPALYGNAFWVLGVTVRDDRRRIVERAEEKLLELDPAICQRARAALTNPRVRVREEVGWLPGVSPKKASQLAKDVAPDSEALREAAGLPPLAHANLLAAAFESVDYAHDASGLADVIMTLGRVSEAISVEVVMRDINEDRAVAGFPPVNDPYQVETELAERRSHYRSAMIAALDRLPVASLVDAVTWAVTSATANGERLAPPLIDELVDSYALQAERFLEEEGRNIELLIAAVQEVAGRNGTATKAIIDKLEVVARNWDKVAQPIQLSFMARGMPHEHSHRIAHSIRSLAVDLFNDHEILDESQRLTTLLESVFAEVPEVSERVAEDLEALEAISNNYRQSELRRREWEREIEYQVELGLIFKDVLRISHHGITWKNRHVPLEAITRARWGGVRHSVNGIPTGTTFTVAFGDDRSESVIETRNSEIFSMFTQKLYRAVGTQLLIQMLQSLGRGEDVIMGEAVIQDGGITLIRRRFLSSDKTWHPWRATQTWSADGSFYIGARDDKERYVSLSYIGVPNVHILEQAIRTLFQRPDVQRFSDLLG